MGKPHAPPPPDYVGAAREQGEQNLETAQFNAGVNRPNQFNQYGSQVWALRPGADPKNPQPGDYILTTSLNPTQQRLFDSQNAISQGFLNSGQRGLSLVDAMMGTDFNPNLPGMTGSVSPTGYVNPTTQSGSGPNLRAGISTDTADATRQRVQEALMARITPYYDQQEDRTRTQLLNSGLEVGSEAYNSELRRLNEQRTDATNQATISAGMEASRILADQRANEQAAAGINAQQFGLGLQQQGQAYGQNLSSANQLYQQLLQSGQFGNQARQQSLQEALLRRELPMNEVNALRTGNQVGTPPNSGFAPTNAQPNSELLNALMAKGQYEQNAYGQQMSGYNSTLNTAATLAAMYFLSDRRLKINLRPIGKHPIGVTRYLWDWADGSGSDYGVVAQELLEVFPAAVGVMPNGYLGVRYGMIGGR